MRAFYYDFQIDGKPILVPDADIVITDIDEETDDSGKDESGFYHRAIKKRGTQLVISYFDLNEEEVTYLKSLLMGKNNFRVTHRLYGQTPVSFYAYCKKFPRTLRNAVRGQYKKTKITIDYC